MKRRRRAALQVQDEILAECPPWHYAQHPVYLYCFKVRGSNTSSLKMPGKDVRCISGPGTSGRATVRCRSRKGCHRTQLTEKAHRTCMLFHRPALAWPAVKPLKAAALPPGISARRKGIRHVTFDDPFDADRKLSRSGCVCGSMLRGRA